MPPIDFLTSEPPAYIEFVTIGVALTIIAFASALEFWNSRSASAAKTEWRRYFVNPNFAFIAAWLLVAGLCAIRWAPTFEAQYTPAIIVSMVIVLMFSTGYASGFFIPVRSGLAEVEVSPRLISYATLLWSLITVGEILYSGGLPIMWLYDGSGRTYDTFGISGLHGFANALWMLSVFGTVAVMTKEPSLQRSLVLLVLIAFIIASINRALMLLTFVQCSFYVLATDRLRFAKSIACIAVAFLLIGLVFGKLGDVRQPLYNVYRSTGISAAPTEPVTPTEPATPTATINIEIPQQAPPPIKRLKRLVVATSVWGYVYVVSPVCNLALNIKESKPLWSWFPKRTSSIFLPTLMKRAVGIDTSFSGDFGTLVNGAFNFWTAFREPYSDYGLPGLVAFALGLGLSARYIWNTQRHNLALLSAVSMCFFFTIFNNQMFQPMIVMYLLLLTAATHPHWVRSR